jgi:hypothetical protein
LESNITILSKRVLLTINIAQDKVMQKVSTMTTRAKLSSKDSLSKNKVTPKRKAGDKPKTKKEIKVEKVTFET